MTREEHEPIRGNPRTADLHILSGFTRILVRGREVGVVETKCGSGFRFSPNLCGRKWRENYAIPRQFGTLHTTQLHVLSGSLSSSQSVLVLQPGTLIAIDSGPDLRHTKHLRSHRLPPSPRS